MNNLIVRTLLALFLMLSISSCGGGGGGSTNACSDLNLRITNGDSCNVQKTSVALILVEDTRGQVRICTGTFITLDDVLTAAHCFKDLADFMVVTETKGFLASAGEIKRAGVHPSYVDLSGSGPGTFLLFDFALVTISQPADVSPVPINISNPLLNAENVTVYGFGKNEEGRAALERAPTDLLRAGYMKTSDVRNGIFAADFDLTGSSICNGDSGGPAIQVIDGVSSIVGVTSMISGSQCLSGSRAFFGNLQHPPIYNWIKSYASDVTLR